MSSICPKPDLGHKKDTINGDNPGFIGFFSYLFTGDVSILKYSQLPSSTLPMHLGKIPIKSRVSAPALLSTGSGWTQLSPPSIYQVLLYQIALLSSKGLWPPAGIHQVLPYPQGTTVTHWELLFPAVTAALDFTRFQSCTLSCLHNKLFLFLLTSTC